MEKHIDDPKTGLQYELQGDYYVIAGENKVDIPSIGIWGQRHLRWLKQNRRVTYTNLLSTGILYDYLQAIDNHANEQLELLIRQLAENDGITEPLKAENQMEWVRRMNSIRNRAEEIVLNELIFAY